MKSKSIIKAIASRFPSCSTEFTTFNSRLCVVGYFNDLCSIKKDIFGGSDYVIITKRNDSKFMLSAFIN